MVQYWQLINLDRRETLGQWGELSDIMSSPIPDAAFLYLAADTRRGSWAGGRIVCIGDYAITYPKGMLTHRELEEIEDMYLDEDNSEEGYEDDDPAPTLYAFAEEWYSDQPMSLADPHSLDGESEYPERKVWHLRNLNRREYVRSDALGLMCPERASANSKVAPGLCHALLACVCWSTEKERFGSRKDGEVEMGQGKWAGDRIEICLANAVNDEEEGWKDISPQVSRQLANIWKSQGL
ncbi:hypothetical protein AX17_003227 [Amanita inopinata Kibby_2008]|nr:hypothetical protein AX17_003227 [Amanita inopinata Kibby_2008]